MRNVAFLAFDITRPFEVAHMCASRSSPAAAARSCTFRPACAPSLSHLVPLPLIRLYWNLKKVTEMLYIPKNVLLRPPERPRRTPSTPDAPSYVPSTSGSV